MVGYEAADTQITNVRISSTDKKVERMAGFVSWLSDVICAVCGGDAALCQITLTTCYS